MRKKSLSCFSKKIVQECINTDNISLTMLPKYSRENVWFHKLLHLFISGSYCSKVKMTGNGLLCLFFNIELILLADIVDTHFRGGKAVRTWMYMLLIDVFQKNLVCKIKQRRINIPGNFLLLFNVRKEWLLEHVQPVDNHYWCF